MSTHSLGILPHQSQSCRVRLDAPYVSVFCLLLFTSILIITHPLYGQWAATYGGEGWDEAHCIQQIDDGGYIVAGKTSSFGAGDNDVWVLKLSPDGVVEWQKTYGGSKPDEARCVQQTSDRGYIVVGRTESFGAGEDDIWVIKLGPDGGVEWQKTYGGISDDKAQSIRQTHDGGYLVAGVTESFGLGTPDIWILKLKPNGAIEWQKVYGGNDFDVARFAQQTSDGGYIVAGWTSSPRPTRMDVWVLKLRPDGTIEWQKTYGGYYDDCLESFQQTKDGGYIVAGFTCPFARGIRDMDLWVLKLGADGTAEWAKAYGSENFEKAYSVQQTRDGGYIVAGETRPFNFNDEGTNAWVLKLRPDGTIEGQKTYGGYTFDKVESIQQTRDGGYITSGVTGSFGRADLWVLKLRPDGSISPFCDFLIRDISAREKVSGLHVKTTSISPRDSIAHPQDSLAIIQDTNVSANFLCPTVMKTRHSPH